MTIDPIDVRDLLGHPGASRTESFRGSLEGLGTEVARVREDSPVAGELLLESVIEGMLVSGVISGTLQLRCARCLTEFDAPFQVSVQELFVGNPDPETDDYPLAGSVLEPEQMVRDAVGVELPFSPLCRPDCLGICEVCGGDRNAGECPGNHASLDPVWSGLEEIRNRLEQLKSQ